MSVQSAYSTPAGGLARSVRTHRQAAGLTLGALALRSGVSKAGLSTIEAGEGNPSLETLWRLAGTFGLPLGSPLGEFEPPRTKLTRAGQGTPVASESGLAGELLLSEGRAHRTEVITFALPAGADYRAAPHQPGTEELILCITGTIDVRPVGSEARLRRSDCLWFPSDCAHRYASRGGRELRDELSALLKDYEMADEVSHGQFGIRWAHYVADQTGQDYAAAFAKARRSLEEFKSSHDSEVGASAIPLVGLGMDETGSARLVNVSAKRLVGFSEEEIAVLATDANSSVEDRGI